MSPKIDGKNNVFKTNDHAGNDSALSSFHNHNMKKNKEESSQMDKNDLFKKTNSTEGLMNSKDDFFLKNKNYNKFMPNEEQQSQSDKNIYPENVLNINHIQKQRISEQMDSLCAREIDSDNDYVDIEKRVLDEEGFNSGNFKSDSKYCELNISSNRNSAPEDIYSFRKDPHIKTQKKLNESLHSNNQQDSQEEFERTKRYIQSYLSELEKSNKVKLNYENNKWVIDFSSNPNTTQKIENKDSNSSLKEINCNSKSHSISKQKSKSKSKAVEVNKYYDLKNQIEILKKEKKNLENIIKDSSNTSRIQGTMKDSKNYSNSNKSTLNNKKSNSFENSDNFYSRDKLNRGVFNSGLKSKEDYKDFEEETLKKIHEDDLFEMVGYQKEDPFGDLVDRVIERSLYIYKNR
jgi:hypothetical protein